VSKTKAAEVLCPAMDARLRTTGATPTLIPKPEPDMKIPDLKKRAKAHAKALRNVEHANLSTLARARASVNEPWFGCPAGRAAAVGLASMKPADLDMPMLWEAIQRVRAVYSRYWQAIGAPSPNPRGMDLELLPEEFGSDGVQVDGGWDDRSERERVEAATNAMMHMERVLGMAGYGVSVEVKAVVLRDEQCRHVDRLIAGLAAVAREG